MLKLICASFSYRQASYSELAMGSFVAFVLFVLLHCVSCFHLVLLLTRQLLFSSPVVSRVSSSLQQLFVLVIYISIYLHNCLFAVSV